MMRIAFIDTLGLTYDGSTLSKRGLGGSESAVIRMSQELVKLGMNVTVFNDCTSDDSKNGYYDGVKYVPVKDHNSFVSGFDVCIVSRSVTPIAEQWPIIRKSKHVCLWMHDTFCEGDDQIEYLINQGLLDEIFTLSDWHTGYVTHCDHGFRRNYDVLKNHIFMTRNGIGKMNPDWIDVRDKDPNLFVFNASVTKGMVPLVKQIWPRVKQQIPAAQLKIIGGFYKFREAAGPDQQQKDWEDLKALHSKDIEFTGVITQQEISDILRKASYMIYPAGFPETFGISTLEALAHNVPLITCQFGALEETAIDLASWKIKYPVEPNWSMGWLNQDSQVDLFVNEVVKAYNDKYLHQQKMYACNQVKDICTWNTVALQWKQHLYKKTERFLPLDEYKKVSVINNKVRKVFNRRFMSTEEFIEPKNEQRHIDIVTTCYNAEKYINRCILSVAQQDYDNYTMHIIDDASTDNTRKVIDETVQSLPEYLQHKFKIKTNDINVGAMMNQFSIISTNSVAGLYKESSIQIMLDGDDWLINDPNVFHKYNNIYREGAEFTYGSCWSEVDNIPLIAQEYPPDVKTKKSYRQYKFNWNMPYTHLRTFSSHLAKNLLPTDLQINGKWMKAGGDAALFYYLIERADPDKVVCIPDVVYHYNDANPINDYKVNSDEQTKNANYALSLKTPFAPGQTDLRPL